MNDLSTLKIINARILCPAELIENGTLIVENGVINRIETGDINKTCDFVLDANGALLSAGFIDIHVHGGGGYDFMDNTVDAFHQIAKTHAQYGTTAMAPTTLSSGYNDLVKTLLTYEQALTVPYDGASFIGMHIEGPYFSVKQRGAQDVRFIKDPDPKEYIELVERFPFIKRWSAAPERKGAMEFGDYLVKKGVLPAIAHTDAIFEEVIEAFDHGFTHATHFYSCMSTVSRRNAYRYAGAVEAAYFLDNMTVELIADGIHLPPALLKLVYKLKGPDKIILITDAMRAAGTLSRDSILGSIKNGLKVIIEDGVAKLPDRSAFAGSIATCDQLLKNMVQLTGIPLSQAINMLTLNPAKLMGVEQTKGSIETGKDADLVIFNDDYQILYTIVKGKIVHQANKQQ